MRSNRRHDRRRRIGPLAAVAVLSTMMWLSLTGTPSPTTALEYQRISGEGSSWSANAIDAMRVNVQQFGITVDYNPTGSTAGRKNFLNGTVDFAASDIPFQFEPEDGSAPEKPEPGSYAYMPVTAGGTAFMYNLKINGQRVTNLRLSGENLSKIFTGAIKTWNDPAIQADNPGLTMPARAIVPVVRAEGSGSTQQFSAWMIDRHPAVWQEYCERSGRAPSCGATSFYPTVSGMISQSGDVGVSGYVSQSFAEGAIGYVNYSYALNTQFPVVKLLNAAGYYTEPTPENVAVSLLKAKINTNESQPGDLPHPGPVGCVHRHRSAQLSAVVVLVPHPADEDRRPVQRGQGHDPRRLRVLRDVPGAAVVGVAGVLADAREPGGGELRADPQDPGCRGAGHRHHTVQEPDVLGRWTQRPRRQRTSAAGVRQAGHEPVPHRNRWPCERPHSRPRGGCDARGREHRWRGDARSNRWGCDAGG